MAYDGYTFENTNSEAGYGTMTSGTYHNQLTGDSSGYKPWGALGQGSSKNKSVRLTTTDEERVMLVVISFFHDYATEDYQEDMWQGADMLLEVGAYPWSDIDLTAPVAPASASAISDGAKVLCASLSAAAIAMSLY